MKTKKIILMLLIGSNLLAGPVAVVEVGQNVQMNTLSKIENAKQTLEQIKQTQQQIQQLKNEATNLNNWAATLLKNTVGLTTQDINNLLEIKKMSEDLYRDTKDFQNQFNKNLKIDTTKLSIDGIRSANDDLLKDIAKSKENVINFKGEQQKMLNNLKGKVQEFNNLNKMTMGAVDTQQLGNEISTNIYQSLEKLNMTIQEIEANKEIENIRKSKLEVNNKVQEFKLQEEQRKKEVESYNNFKKTVKNLKGFDI